MENKGPQHPVEGVTRIVLRPLASPLPLGFFAFGTGSVLQSALQLGLVPQGEILYVALVFGVFVFPLELLTAILAFPARDTVGATTLSIIAFSWLGPLSCPTSSRPPTRPAPPLGCSTLSIALILLLLGTVGVLSRPLLATVMFLAFFRYSLSGLFELTEISSLQPISGVFGCLIFALSLYGSLA